MRKYKKLVDIFPDVLTGNGIFSALDALPVPWSNDMDGVTLDMEYFYNISGQKYYSPLVNKILNTSETLTTANVTTLANLIYKMYAKTWVKEYATLSAEYNPISNYDMTETETASGTTSNTVNNTGTQTTSQTGTQSTTHTGTQGTTSTENTTQTTDSDGANNLYGFNSSNAVGDTTSEMNTTASGTDAINATRTDNLTDARTDNLNHQRTDNLTETDSGSHSDSRTLTRSGNIGVTTTQQMLESERALWLWNFFYNVVFPDVDRVLTIATYGNRWNIENS